MALSLDQYKDTWYYSREMKNILIERVNEQAKLSQSFSINFGYRIPEDLIIEILSWLPVRTLLQFKSVCKKWYSIIKSAEFILKHLRNYCDNNNDWRDCLIVQYRVTQAGELNVFEFLMDYKNKQILAYQEILTPKYNTLIYGPCNGIYFLWDIELFKERSLWNPSINEYKVLPRMDSKPNLPTYMTPYSDAHGFGYDPKLNDYKIVIIKGYRNKNFTDFKMTDYPLSIFVYSLKSNSWRYWGDMKNSYYLVNSKSYTFVNGCYYWLGSRLEDSYHYEIVLSFDICADVCDEIWLPKFEQKHCYMSHLVVFHDSIAFVLIPECRTMFDVWIYNAGAWTRKLRMDVGFQYRGGVSHWCDDVFLLRKAGSKLVFCDTGTKDMWELDDPKVGNGIDRIVVHKESLLLIREFSTEAQLDDDHQGDVEQIPIADLLEELMH